MQNQCNGLSFLIENIHPERWYILFSGLQFELANSVFFVSKFENLKI